MGPWPGELGLPMPNIVEFQKDLIEVDHRPPTVFSDMVGKIILHGYLLRFIEG